MPIFRHQDSGLIFAQFFWRSLAEFFSEFCDKFWGFLKPFTTPNYCAQNWLKSSPKHEFLASIGAGLGELLPLLRQGVGFFELVRGLHWFELSGLLTKHFSG